MLIALLLGETTINFIDRQVVSVLAPTLRAEFHLSNVHYAAIVNAFLITYAIALPLAGWMLDRLGVGRGLSLSVTLWSIAGMLTSLAKGPLSLGAFRSLLAMGEAGAWPAFAKAAALWVPPQARTLAIGICNSGSSLGAMIAPPLVAWVTTVAGWRSAFVVTGGLGLLWVGAFQLFRRAHPEMALAERGQVEAAKQIRWRQLIRYRQAWVPFVCRFLADPMWYFFIFWIPEFLNKERGIGLAGIGMVAWIPFLAADLSNFAAGYLTLRLQRAGWSVSRTRKTIMTCSALLSPLGILAVRTQSLPWTIALISLAVFIWMFWSVAVHSLAGDYFPARAVGSVYGFAGMGSTIGSAISTWAVGYTLDRLHSYTPVFIGICMLMPLALIAGLSLMGRVEPVALSD